MSLKFNPFHEIQIKKKLKSWMDSMSWVDFLTYRIYDLLIVEFYKLKKKII